MKNFYHFVVTPLIGKWKDNGSYGETSRIISSYNILFENLFANISIQPLPN